MLASTFDVVNKQHFERTFNCIERFVRVMADKAGGEVEGLGQCKADMMLPSLYAQVSSARFGT